MNCPHCGKEIEQVTTLRPSKIKNLSITAWCPLCKKPKGYAGTLIMGESDDEGLQTVPETCMCDFYRQESRWLPTSVGSVQGGTLEIKF